MVSSFDSRDASIHFNASNAIRQQQTEPLTDGDKSDPARLPLPYLWVRLADVEVAAWTAPDGLLDSSELLLRQTGAR